MNEKKETEDYQLSNESLLRMREGAEAAWNMNGPLVSIVQKTPSKAERFIGEIETFYVLLEQCAKVHFEMFSDEELNMLSDSGYRLCKVFSMLSDIALHWHTLQGFINAEIMQRARE